ncbi:MAG: hypothetical protein L6Q95_06665 [Planctomycetes bacterium]|nr:hypothetical protein [Planctomycetota bacterium]
MTNQLSSSRTMRATACSGSAGSSSVGCSRDTSAISRLARRSARTTGATCEDHGSPALTR